MAEPKPLVLLVEDNPDITTLETHCLEAEGYTVVSARDGRHALALLEVVRPAVIVCDMMMPEMDGLAFLRTLATRPGPQPPVLAVSAFDSFLPAAVELGAAATLRKPFTVDAFVGSVHAVARGAAAPPSPRAVPLDERQRLLAVLELHLDEPSTGGALDQFTERVARIFDVPVALVSIVTADRQYWHACHGITGDLEAARGTARQDSFCTHAVVAQAALVVQDAAAHPFFARNALVRDRGLRFYAGVPLRSATGLPLGTLCIIDYQPRRFGPFDLELLSVLAKRVVAELAWRELRRNGGPPLAAVPGLSHLDEELDILGREALLEGLHVQSLRSSESGRPLSLAVLDLPGSQLGEAVSELKLAFPRALFGRLGASRIGVLALDLGREETLLRAARAAGEGGRVEALEVPRLLGGSESLVLEAESALARRGAATGGERPPSTPA